MSIQPGGPGTDGTGRGVDPKAGQRKYDAPAPDQAQGSTARRRLQRGALGAWLASVPAWAFWSVAGLVAALSIFLGWRYFTGEEALAPEPPVATQTLDPSITKDPAALARGVNPGGNDGSNPATPIPVDNVPHSDEGFGGWTDGGTTGENEPDVAGEGASGPISTKTMRPMSVFIPSIKAYGGLVGTHKFVPGTTRGMKTIEVPKNPRWSSWFDQGSPLAGSTKGVTNLSGHIAYARRWGTFHNLASARPGNTVWTKDVKGKLQKWTITTVYSLDKGQYPQDFWSTTGPPKLVMATCTGKVINHVHQKNLFAEAVPVK